MNRTACDKCGGDARLCVLAGYKHGEPVLRYRCLACADRPIYEAVETRNNNRFGPGALMVVAGGLLGLFATFADGIPGYTGLHVGFGVKQQLGVGVGSLLVLFGAILRIDIIGIAGTLLFIMALGADLFDFSRTPGVGWKQQALLAAAAVLVCTGLIVRARARGYYRQKAMPTAAGLKAGVQ